MDKYLTNEDNIRMFKRIIEHSEDLEVAEKVMTDLFECIIPSIEESVEKPYSLFKRFQEFWERASLQDSDYKYLTYREISLYYIEDHESYETFSDKHNLNIFLELIWQEEERLADVLNIGFDRREVVQVYLMELEKDLATYDGYADKHKFLLQKKLEVQSRLNYDVIPHIDSMIETIERQSNSEVLYIASTRIKSLENASLKWDTTKIVQICNEINNAYKTESFLSIPTLIRMLMDHIPPIFGFSNFPTFVAQYGSKSFKKSMNNLDKSLRNIADEIIHSHIRNKEILPSCQQIDFIADLDVLLAEICRVLK